MDFEKDQNSDQMSFDEFKNKKFGFIKWVGILSFIYTGAKEIFIWLLVYNYLFK